MVSKVITVKNESGLHLRPAGLLANTAGKMKSDITIKYENNDINAKSVLNIMAAGIQCGKEIELICDGETEQEDLNQLVELIDSGLGE